MPIFGLVSNFYASFTLIIAFHEMVSNSLCLSSPTAPTEMRRTYGANFYLLKGFGLYGLCCYTITNFTRSFCNDECSVSGGGLILETWIAPRELGLFS